MGVGGALIVPSTLSVTASVFTMEERPKAIGIWTGVSGLGIVAGPVLAGWLLEHFAWGSIFLINVPVVLISRRRHAGAGSRGPFADAAKLDLPGAALSIGGLVALVYGVIEAPANGWTSPSELAVFGLAALLPGRLRRSRTDHADPLLDVRMLCPAGLRCRGAGGPAHELRPLRLDVLPEPVPAGRARASGPWRRASRSCRWRSRWQSSARSAWPGEAFSGTKLTSPTGMAAVAAGLWSLRLAGTSGRLSVRRGHALPGRRRHGLRHEPADGGHDPGPAEEPSKASLRRSTAPLANSAERWAWRSSAASPLRSTRPAYARHGLSSRPGRFGRPRLPCRRRRGGRATCPPQGEALLGLARTAFVERHGCGGSGQAPPSPWQAWPWLWPSCRAEPRHRPNRRPRRRPWRQTRTWPRRNLERTAARADQERAAATRTGAA
jgi:hypothetical protein